MTPLTEAVRWRIDRLFPPGSRPAARRLLEERCGEGLPLSGSTGRGPEGFDRVRFAVLKLSKGELSALEREVEGANVDWRDTLVAAGFGADAEAHRSWIP